MDQREEFVRRSYRKEMSFAALCREYGISPKTGYKWLGRFDQQGKPGLQDLSRQPHSSSQATTEDVACELVRLRLAHPTWGATKLQQLYVKAHPLQPVPAESTIKRVLGKAQLVEPRRKRRPQAQCGRLTNRFVPTAPNQLWTVDFKGWWYSTARERVLPLTVCDAFSRFVLAVEIVPDSTTVTVQACFARLFTQYGLPLAIRSDNGSPFASKAAPLGLSRLSVWWTALGINLDRIKPGHPEQNGSHERMHRDIALEVEGRVAGDLQAQQAALDIWREEYNTVRPHGALGLGTPAEHYRRSERCFDPSQRPVIEYPLGFWRRLVSSNGCIKLENRSLLLSTALCGWDVGLQPLRTQQFVVWFGGLRLGELDVPTEKFTVTPAADAGLVPAPPRHYHQPKPLPMS